jgi:large subunit ribosomal protein L25
MKLTLTKREGKTKGETKKIRREGNIPAVLYGHGHHTLNAVVPGAAFQAVLRNLESGQLATRVFELELEGKTHSAVVKDITYHPASYAIEHIDFVFLSPDRPVTVKVPIQVLGTADCPGIKLGGTLRQVIRTLRVTCLPKNIPSEFQIDVRTLNIMESKRLSDIDMPTGVKPLALMSEVVVVIAKAKATA